MLEQCRVLLSTARLVNPGACANVGVNFVESLVRPSKPLTYPVILDIVLTKAWGTLSEDSQNCQHEYPLLPVLPILLVPSGLQLGKRSQSATA